MLRALKQSHCAVVLVGVLLGLNGCVPVSDQTPLPINVAKGLQAEYIVASALHPSALATTSDGRVFYAEKNTGRIRVIQNDVLLAEPFASVPVNYAGNRGVLAIALHPRFNLTGRLYVLYTRSDTGLSTDDAQAVVDHRVVYFEADDDVADDDEADENISSSGEVFVASLPVGTQTVRVGGRLAFAADETLLVALGDLGNDGDVQNADVLSGKILRYNDDGSIPADNPNPESAVYAIGFREPHGLTIDPRTHAPFLTERSANGVHEVNRILAGKNYGWPNVVGFADTADELAFADQEPTYADPLVDSALRREVFVGAAFNPSSKYGPNLQQRLFYGLEDAGHIVSLELTDARTAAEQADTFATGLPTPITDVAFTPSGTLYVATEDAILRIVTFR